MTEPRIYPFGDSALVCEAPPPATLACQERIWALAQAAREWAHVVEAVPGMNNLTIVFDPLRADMEALARQLAQAWDRTVAVKAAAREIEIPVRYGGEDGPDLHEVAQHAGLSAEEVVRRHSSAEYVVFFIGFQPGFAYLGGLDASLHTPRRAVPRLEVPAGSVGIGGAQTGVYPAASPGGWQLIGRTASALFDPARNPPTLLQSGDRVRFSVVEVAL
ncbi:MULTISPECIES: 5-oxoprolinase subunit PxpB [unclassified Trinickia]|uniref:5-oxoprolinase subunit PxpB n=1 Tax=unclassified Trinickia TaxID=2638168 RepID=UPI0024057670|nr:MULTISPECIES: 5-oxoprolinase subunit PxpB [unclassified Trinickia]MDG0023676.1 5-oxoprolinase subunit PxpB [Trinickia sp. Y13]HVW49719.1 5-oxoprolinase subunit PxpB [Trinickia sp.]